MKYYERTIIVKDYQGSHGKAVWVPQRQFFKTNSEEFLKEANKGKRIRFAETEDKSLVKTLRKSEANKIYRETEKLSEREVYWRKSASFYKR